MPASGVAATPPPRPWTAFLVGGTIGLAILLLTQILSDTRIALGPWTLNGNGALAVPFIGFPLAVYAGWTRLADRHDGRELAIWLATFSAGVILGSGLLGLFFGLPVALVSGAIYGTWARGATVPRSDRLLWIAFGASSVVAALPFLGLFGVAVLPGSLILIARDKPTSTRVGLGALLVAATVLVVFVVPLLVPPPSAAR